MMLQPKTLRIDLLNIFLEINILRLLFKSFPLILLLDVLEFSSYSSNACANIMSKTILHPLALVLLFGKG